MRGGRGGITNMQTPYFQIDIKRLERNLERLSWLEKESGVKILHTLKSFNHPKIIPLIASKLSGFSVSSLIEVNMAIEANAQNIHLYAPAFKEDNLKELISKVSTLSLNSLSQWERFGNGDFSPEQRRQSLPIPSNTSIGVRINPKLHLPIPSYCNPNLSYSRLGVDYQKFLETFNLDEFKNLEGLHFHALFQSSVEGASILLDHIMAHYQNILPQLRWVNFGGGHNFTDKDYDTKRFIELSKNFKLNYPHIQLYFEPGESVLRDTGEFVATVLDIIDSIVILDTSIETHLLDVAIVNQRLKVKGTQISSTPYYYELTGNSCLQGDIIGEYFFQKPLTIGDRVVFEDMMSYTMVKMTRFNGMEFAPLIIYNFSSPVEPL
ncbi:carboxynorspermidine decarboxylase [Sulfurovum sp. bin170]|uniref:carboxynorspermidine decarboxylase n=1 Tax=Sulfurovum sp. bin170 TaxID=2695268 RepID=UPI0013DF9C3E|nr:carboxynorspermidine decarboxylase [Sulfurovum sp. bin170]NEW60461.1 carboxynorspermidine decarboxylase [Sulfurovum sp. bin170]